MCFVCISGRRIHPCITPNASCLLHTMHVSKLSQILNLFSHKGITPSDFILSLLASSLDIQKPTKDSIIKDVACIFDTFSIALAAVSAVRTWAHEASKTIYMKQVQQLTHPSLGFHFNALNASADQIESFSMDKMEKTMELQAPHLCDLVSSLLLNLLT
jgi:hypothetical protein